MQNALKLSVIIPCYNEEDVIATTYERLMNVIESNGYNMAYEVIFIDDGSRDRTLSILEEKAQEGLANQHQLLWPHRP